MRGFSTKSCANGHENAEILIPLENPPMSRKCGSSTPLGILWNNLGCVEKGTLWKFIIGCKRHNDHRQGEHLLGPGR